MTYFIPQASQLLFKKTVIGKVTKLAYATHYSLLKTRMNLTRDDDRWGWGGLLLLLLFCFVSLPEVAQVGNRGVKP